MAISTVLEIWEGRQHALDAKGVRSYTRIFRVRTDTKTDDAALVRKATGLPAIGDSFGAGDSEALVTRVSPQQNPEDPRVWIVSIEYSSDPGGNQAFDDENPFLRAPIESLRFDRFSLPFDKDINGKAVVNSVGDRFVPAPEREVSRLVLSITRNESSFAYSTATKFVDTVNSSGFRTVPPGDARMIAISANQRFESGTSFFEVTYEIAFQRGFIGPDGKRKGGWTIDVQDSGFRVKDPSQPDGYRALLVPVKYADGSISEEIPSNAPPLDGEGKQVPQGGKLFFINFTPYPSEDFNSLNL